MHAGASAGSHDGFFRRRMCGVLRLQTARRGSKSVNIREAILRKVRESADVKQQFFEENAVQIEALCREMAQRFLQGKKLFVMGNGGSAFDALHVSVEFKHPIIEKKRPRPVEASSADHPAAS